MVAALNSNVKTIPIDDTPPARFGLAWRAKGYRGPASGAFLQLARRVFAMPG